MKNLFTIAVVITILFCGCTNGNDNTADVPSAIVIGNYNFNFPTHFKLKEKTGIDSYVGTIEGSGIILHFDYGWYTIPASNLPANEYLVTEDVINGHFRQIVKPFDPKQKVTQIHLYSISEAIESPYGYNSLTLSTSNLTLKEQEMIISVFSTVEIN